MTMAISNSIFGGTTIDGNGPYVTGAAAQGLYGPVGNSAQQMRGSYEYERERFLHEEEMRYQAEQMRRMMNQPPVAVMPTTPKAPDPLGFLNKADNKLLLTKLEN